ncbi:unannotated protein [freshwater metagenome]|uniref:Unannotated protein n=1 Tax=freshwater metagenome TaxID=449393 RepID=A0A6J7GB17_9ZZZZ
MAFMMSVDAAAKSADFGACTTEVAGSTICSAYAPPNSLLGNTIATTRSPTLRRSSFSGPTASITPDASIPGIKGGSFRTMRWICPPARKIVSVGFTVTA